MTALRRLSASRPFAAATLLAAYLLATFFRERVRQAFLDMRDPDLLSRFPRKGFIPADNDDFRPILETARKLDLVE